MKNWPAAEQDYAQAAANFPENAYPALWRYLAAARGGKDDTTALRAAAGKFTSADWPMPVVLLFLDLNSAESVLQSAESVAGNSPARKQQLLCEADFYLGERALLKGDTALAKKYFQATLSTNISAFIEFRIAKVELQALQ